jgi:hypothetical protein
MTRTLTPGTLVAGEPHPSALSAVQWIRSLPFERVAIHLESFASSAIEGNRFADICHETLRRFVSGEPVSDRYILGLAWALREMEDGSAVETLPGDLRLS